MSNQPQWAAAVNPTATLVFDDGTPDHRTVTVPNDLTHALKAMREAMPWRTASWMRADGTTLFRDVAP